MGNKYFRYNKFARNFKKPKKKITAVIITSDKVYKNIEVARGYSEEDNLGGFDPYSASKSYS